MNSFIIKCPNCGKEIIITNEEVQTECTYIKKDGMIIATGSFSDIWITCECGNKIG